MGNYFNKNTSVLPTKEDVASTQPQPPTKYVQNKWDLIKYTECDCEFGADFVVNNTAIYVVGSDRSNELCQQAKQVIRLTSWNENSHNKNKCITDIHCGNQYTIYSNIEQQYFNREGRWYFTSLPTIRGMDNYIGQQFCTKTKYFKDNNIKIQKICTNITSQYTRWITDKDFVYSDDSENGFGLISGLYNVMDVKSNDSDIIALCSSDSTLIIEYFCRNMGNIKLGVDVITLISSFRGGTVVYKKQNKKWIKIEFIQTIIKIECTLHQWLFLDTNGDLWITKGMDDPVLVLYFIGKNIKIRDVSCGWMHSLILTKDGIVYAFGNNNQGQCGAPVSAIDKNEFSPNNPNKIPVLKNIHKIKCGAEHSYAVTNDNKHFLWGDNQYNQCLATITSVYYNGIISHPKYINSLVTKATNKTIKDVFLGYGNTKLLLV